jgi:hypothetical protein
MKFAVRYILLLGNVVPVACNIPSAVLQLPLTIWCRFCEAARRVLHTTEVNDPVFLHLALQHRYLLQCLSTTELTPSCDLASYLEQMIGSASWGCCSKWVDEQQ